LIIGRNDESEIHMHWGSGTCAQEYTRGLGLFLEKPTTAKKIT
jgi:hypothetical protein